MLYEINAVQGAQQTLIAPTSTLEPGMFTETESMYTLATLPHNVPTDMNVDINNVAEISKPAIGAFRIRDLNAFKVMVGGRSSLPGSNDRGYCFGMRQPVRAAKSLEPALL